MACYCRFYEGGTGRQLNGYLAIEIEYCALLVVPSFSIKPFSWYWLLGLLVFVYN